MNATLSDKIRAFLAERRYAVLATINPDGTPQLSAMWYELDGDTILMNTKAGRIKERNMRRDPRVSICFEDGGYLTITGRVKEMIDDQEIAQRDILRLATRYEGEESAKKQMEATFGHEHRVTIRITIDRIIESLW
jgi:PPOX class probable F420-dependent enzyme